MLELKILPNGDGQWPDLKQKEEEGKLIEVTNLEIAGLPVGMSSGMPSVAIRIDLEDGRTVFAQTSLRLFLTCAEVLVAVHGDPRLPPSKPTTSA